MEKLNLYIEALKPRRKTIPGSSTFKAVDFDVDLLTYNPENVGRLHICGKEEFYYVIRGEVEMQIDSESLHLKDGDAIMVKPGEKHKHKIKPGGAMLLVTKRPHSHTYFD